MASSPSWATGSCLGYVYGVILRSSKPRFSLPQAASIMRNLVYKIIIFLVN